MRAISADFELGNYRYETFNQDWGFDRILHSYHQVNERKDNNPELMDGQPCERADQLVFLISRYEWVSSCAMKKNSRLIRRKCTD